MKNYSSLLKVLLPYVIIGLGFSIPVVGARINIIGLLDIAAIVLAIIILVKGRGDTNIGKTSPILMIVASVINIIGTMVVIALSIEMIAEGVESDPDVIQGLIVIGSVFGGVSWICRVIATGFGIFQYQKISKVQKELEQK